VNHSRFIAPYRFTASRTYATCVHLYICDFSGPCNFIIIFYYPVIFVPFGGWRQLLWCWMAVLLLPCPNETLNNHALPVYGQDVPRRTPGPNTAL
jgi:hypothetical protein